MSRIGCAVAAISPQTPSAPNSRRHAATMAVAAGENPAGQRFRVSARTVHGLFGLVTISQASLQKALAGQLVGGKEVTQVKIKTKTRWIDLLVTGLTAGLIVPRTVIYEGVVVGR